jgi:P-type E1-E2 ATPase
MVLLDKTGTVTEGEMTLVEIAVADRFTPEYVLGLAAAAELGSEHPIARAIVAGAHERDVSVPDASGHIVHPGAGAEALVGNHVVSIVRADDVPAELLAAREDWSRRGLTLSAVLRDGATIGLVAVADRPKPEARSTVSRIQGMGLEVGILTGDRKQTAEAIAESVGVRRVLAEVYPEGKVAEIQALKSGGRRVIFVGDGLNDAPALASADVGIALGSGTDVALAAADVNLLGEDLEGLADALELAHRTYRVIQENLFWAFAYNAMMIPAAVAGALDPMLAAAAMALSSITVVANALRLRGFQRGGSPGNTRAREGVDAQRAPSRAGPEGVSSIGTKDDRQWTR